MPAKANPSSRRAARAAPLPQGERGKRICVAQIGAAHGLKGEVHLRSFTQDPRAVARYGALETEDGAQKFEVESLRAAKDHFVAKLSGIDNRDAAQALRNVKLYVPRARLPAPENKNTYYHADLIGLTVATTRAETIGEIMAIHNFGAGDIIEIRLTDGETAMLPFTDAAVPVIDIAAGKVIVNPPEGALAQTIPPLKGEGRRPSGRAEGTPDGKRRRGGVKVRRQTTTPSRSRSARSTSPFQGED